MTVRFRWDWEPDPSVRLPELAATWCRLTIDLDETAVTLVERRDGSGGPRHGLDVPMYPLAEYLAVNWWRLNSSSHPPVERGVRFLEAGSGFAWPDLTIRCDRGLAWVTLRRRDKAPEHVRFLTQAETVLDAEAVIASISELIDSTVRRLEDGGVTGTLLQDEWAAIQAADDEERAYCLVAAAWGQDPYDTAPEVERLLLQAGERLSDPGLLAELARAMPPERILESTNWLLEASRFPAADELKLPVLGSLDWSSASGVAPWRIGYERARRLRLLMNLDSATPAPVDDLLTVHQTPGLAPINVDAMVTTDNSSVAVVVGARTSASAKRFVAARAVARLTLDPSPSKSLLTRATQYTERTERAFAAELLAPASGIESLLDGDFSDEAIQRVADHYYVNPILVQRQVDNQVAA